MFAFGGSIMATLFREGAIEFDQDLREHTADMCETRCKLRSSLGRATGRRGQATAGPSAAAGGEAAGARY